MIAGPVDKVFKSLEQIRGKPRTKDNINERRNAKIRVTQDELSRITMTSNNYDK